MFIDRVRGNDNLEAEVWFNRRTNEYSVTIFEQGEYVPDSEYYTTDREDALEKARLMVERRR